MNPPRWFLWVVVTAIVLWALSAGRAYLIPIAIALVLFSLLAALIDRITKFRLGGWSVPRPLATVIGLIIIAYALFLMVSVMSAQVEAVIAASPRYVSRTERGSPRPGRGEPGFVVSGSWFPETWARGTTIWS